MNPKLEPDSLLHNITVGRQLPGATVLFSQPGETLATNGQSRPPTILLLQANKPRLSITLPREDQLQAALEPFYQQNTTVVMPPGALHLHLHSLGMRGATIRILGEYQRTTTPLEAAKLYATTLRETGHLKTATIDAASKSRNQLLDYLDQKFIYGAGGTSGLISLGTSCVGALIAPQLSTSLQPNTVPYVLFVYACACASYWGTFFTAMRIHDRRKLTDADGITDIAAYKKERAKDLPHFAIAEISSFALRMATLWGFTKLLPEAARVGANVASWISTNAIYLFFVNQMRDSWTVSLRNWATKLASRGKD